MPPTIEEVIANNSDALLELPGVALGEKDGRPCIVVTLAEDSIEGRNRIPGTIDGYHVIVRTS